MLRRRRVCLTALAWLLSAGSWASAADRTDLDWSALARLPVLHNGRIMPLDTFARQQVSAICGKESPALGLKGAVPVRELQSERLAGARQLFPDGKPRKFQAIELLMSWLFEPEKWEDVPFLLAKHEDLRKRYLDLPLKNDVGEPLVFVSPRQVKEAIAFHEHREELGQKQNEAKNAGRELELSGVDLKLRNLYAAYTLYRQLTFDPSHVATFAASQQEQTPSRFAASLFVVRGTWSGLAESLGPLTPLFGETGGGSQVQQWTTEATTAVDKLVEQARNPSVSLQEVEPSVLTLVKSSQELTAFFSRLSKQFAEKPPEWQDEKQVLNARALLRRLAWDSSQLSQQSAELLLSLYDNGESLRLAPALSAAALERERDPKTETNPWLSYPLLLHGSDAALAGYPKSELASARAAFADLTRHYRSWQVERDAKPAEAFAAASNSVEEKLRQLSRAIEPLAARLPIRDRDEALLAHTAYPPPGETDTEVLYNHWQPFLGSWVLCLMSLGCFALAFGWLRGPMFAGGMALLLACLAWTAFGFYLRVSITHWAPVTNMYETVIYVPFFLSLLGVWFLALPLAWPGLKNAWRMTAIPGIWESKPLEASQLRFLRESKWTWGGWLTLLPRAALMALVVYVLAIAPYSAGERTIVHLKPNVDVGQSMPDANDLLTWFVGMCLLAPAVWYVPRVILTLVLSLVLAPLDLLHRTSPVMPQVYARWPFAVATTAVASFLFVLAWFVPLPGKDIGPLQPVLRDNFWLTIHVLTIVSSYGAGLLAWGLGNITLGFYLFGRYRDPVTGMSGLKGRMLAAGARPLGADADELAAERMDTDDDSLADEVSAAELRRRPPAACAVLTGYLYKAIQVAVLMLIAGTILGGLWADVSWGRFWGWDPKEVWALISGLVYLAILHGRYAGWFGNFGLAVGSVLGASAIVFSWYGVNFVLGAGLHSYGFGEGGQPEVAAGVLGNWLFVAAAAARYRMETMRMAAHVPSQTEAVAHSHVS